MSWSENFTSWKHHYTKPATVSSAGQRAINWSTEASQLMLFLWLLPFLATFVVYLIQFFLSYVARNIFFVAFFIPFIVVILSVCNCVITPLLLLLFIWRCKSQQKRVFIFVCLCTNVFLGHSRQRHCNISKSLVVSNSWWPLQNEAETPSICFARNNSLGGWHAVPYKLCMTHIELPRELLSCLKINTSAPLL